MPSSASAPGLIERFGAPDVVVNNASNFRHDFPGEGDPDLLAASLGVHVEAPFQIIEAAARAKPHGATLNVFNILDQKLINPNPDYYLVHARQGRRCSR